MIRDVKSRDTIPLSGSSLPFQIIIPMNAEVRKGGGGAKIASVQFLSHRARTVKTIKASSWYHALLIQLNL
jgi:hypothetical protein